MPSTPNVTQNTSINVVPTISSSLSVREKGQLAVRTVSLPNSTTPVPSKRPTNLPRPESQTESLSSGQTKKLYLDNAPEVSPAQLDSDQDSNLRKSGKVTPTKDACLVSTVSQAATGYSQSLTVQPLAEDRLTQDPNNTVGLAVCTETETPITHQDDSSKVYTQEDMPQALSGTIQSSANQDIDEGKCSSSFKPILNVEQSEDGIILSWDLISREGESKVVKYELYVMSVPTESSTMTDWESLGVVDALALPMACTMTQFLPGASYYFAVRAITASGHCELFSDPCSITVNGSP